MTDTHGEDFASEFHAAGQQYADHLHQQNNKPDTAELFAAFIQNQLNNQEN